MAKEGNMLIARNTVVTLQYSVKDSDGTPVDEGTAPLVYLHGAMAAFSIALKRTARQSRR